MRRTLNDSFFILESESILAANSSGVRTTIFHDLGPDSLVTRYDSAAGPPRELGIGLFLKTPLCGWMPVRIQCTYIQPPPLILFLLIPPTSTARTGNNQGHNVSTTHGAAVFLRGENDSGHWTPESRLGPTLA
jgi:hypothetical protein